MRKIVILSAIRHAIIITTTNIFLSVVIVEDIKQGESYSYVQYILSLQIPQRFQ